MPKKSIIQLTFVQLRIRQWPKNLIIFAPLLFAGKLGELHAVIAACACAISFCLISSAVYILNDMVDLKADRLHSVKSSRPLASGTLSLPWAYCMAFLCLVAGSILAFMVRPTLLLIYSLYIAINVLYSLYLKHIILIDILCVSSGFVLRAVAGAVAIHVPASSWFLLCTAFGSIFLALDKRRQELAMLEKNSSVHRKVLGEYSSGLITRLENLLVPSILISYSFYTFQSPHGQWMMLTIPFVLFGVMRYQLISERSGLTSMPEEVFWQDKSIEITLILWIITCTLIIYGHPMIWMHNIATFLDTMGGG